MLEQKRNPHHSRIRLFFALMLAMAAVLLIGAGRLGDSMATRQTEQEQMRMQWKNAAETLLHRQTTANSAASRKLQILADTHPEYILQSLHLNLRAEQND